MELSSFQLELMSTSPHIAGVLNITPNHLDRHKTMNAYIAAKRHIVQHQGSTDYAVLGQDDTNAYALRSETAACVYTFSVLSRVKQGSYLENDNLVLSSGDQTTPVCYKNDIRLRGRHNILNTLAAISLAHLADTPVAAMSKAIKRFEGVVHRLEEVRLLDGVLWVNDSIATAPERVLAALASFDEPLVLLAGGRDKDLPWEELAREVLQRVRIIIIFGEAGPLIHRFIQQASSNAEHQDSTLLLQEIHILEDLEDAVSLAHKKSQPGDVVLLSPGGTSFDAYRDFAERGEHFRQLVYAL
jgi:UDP-N-acetylmuramoylalanine--D-glutamate ligase